MSGLVQRRSGASTIRLAACVLVYLQAVGAVADEPPRPLPRSEAFFGLHFDLHPGKNDTSLGADIREENIVELLTRVQPDWVQYDCKGHAGYTGYPTKVGWPSPGIVQDSLAIWRKLTRARGIGLYIHYSGVWDTAALEHHPEWARVDAGGNRDTNITSVFGPYVDELLIPQLKEVCSAYELDGVWVDGECWATQLDYSPAALAAWKAESGLDAAPKHRGEPHWLEWKMFQRRAFERYLEHWVDALHEARPGLQITSNWMYTTFAPQPVRAKLDFLSGDFTPLGAVDRARLDARYLSSVGHPWDLLAWGFLWGGNVQASLKSAVQLQQEAAIVLSQGGAFQVYYTPTRSGHISESIIAIAGEVADFCRARQEFCHRSTTIPQVALLLCAAEQLERSDAVYAPWGTTGELEGALHALLECHYSVDVLAEHQLLPRLAEYPVVVLPDTSLLPDDLKAALLDYVRSGGNLLLLGEKCARLFELHLGVTLDGAAASEAAELAVESGLVNANGAWQNVTLTTGEPLAQRFATRDTHQPGKVAATLVACEKGRIAAVYGPIAVQFLQSHNPLLRRFLGGVMARLLTSPEVELDAPPTVELVLRRTRTGQRAAHVINLAGQPQANRLVIDTIPATGPMRLRWRLAERPTSLEWVPGEEEVSWTWQDGVLEATLPSVVLHRALVVRE